MPIPRPTIPRVPLNGRTPPGQVRIPGVDYPTTVFEAETPVLAEDTAIAAEIAADAEISIPLITGAIILLGLLYAAKYILVPLLKFIQVPGSGWLQDAINDVLGIITSPIKSAYQWLMHEIALGIEDHAAPVTRVLEAGAWILHDLSVELANLAASMAVATSEIVTTVIPREINRVTAPLRSRIKNLELDIGAYNAIARQNGFANFRTLLKVETPRVTELRTAEEYVKKQGHASLAGALSTYETTYKRVRVYEETVRKLKFYDVPAWIRHITTTIEKTVPETIKKLALRVGKIELKLKPNKFGVPELLAVMSPAAIASFFRPAIPEVCTQVGECAANNLLGSNLWKYFKDLLGLLLAFTIGDIALQDVCAISKLCRDVVGEIEPEIRALVVVTGGMASVGCASGGQTLPPPLY